MDRSILNTLKLILTQRKGQMAIVGLIIASVTVASMTKSYFSGKVSTEQYYNHLEHFFTAVTIVIGLYMGAQSYEDGQSKSGPKTQMALGDHAKAVSVTHLEDSNSEPPTKK